MVSHSACASSREVGKAGSFSSSFHSLSNVVRPAAVHSCKALLLLACAEGTDPLLVNLGCDKRVDLKQHCGTRTESALGGVREELGLPLFGIHALQSAGTYRFNLLIFTWL